MHVLHILAPLGPPCHTTELELRMQKEKIAEMQTYLENRFRIRPAGVLQIRQHELQQPETKSDSRFEEAHWRSENGKSHHFVEFTRRLHVSPNQYLRACEICGEPDAMHSPR